MMLRQICSASLSAWVTGLMSGLISMATVVLKYASVCRPAAHAASVATSSSSERFGMRGL
jgi:hypothetical protein